MLWLVGSVAGLILGSLLSFLISKARQSNLEALLQSARAQIIDIEKKSEALQTSHLEAEKSKVVAETRLQEFERKFEEKQALLDELKNTFKGLASDALKDNNDAFLKVARPNLETVLEQAKGEISEKTNNLQSLLDPLKTFLQECDTKLLAINNTHGGLQTRIDNLSRQTSDLIQTFTHPSLRGKWGESNLRRILEYSGLVQNVNFKEQVSIEKDGKTDRADFVIFMPSGRKIIIDSKFANEAFSDVFNSPEQDRALILKKHGEQVRGHITDLAKRNYQGFLDGSLDCIIMFIPNEASLVAALQSKPSLIEESLSDHIIPASPTVLLAILQVIAYGWREEQLAKNASHIAKLGKELSDRFVPFLQSLQDMGKAIQKSKEAYGKVVGSYESRVKPQLNKFKELGAGANQDLPEIKDIEGDAKILLLENNEN